MKVTLQYFDGCPNWQIARKQLRDVLRALGRDDQVELERVESDEEAERLSFRGSPTILIDGHDPFAVEDAPAGLSCRIYLTDSGYDGLPSVAQLRKALSTSN